MSLIQIRKEQIAEMLAFLGVGLILGVVVFATSNDIAAGEMAYQKLWLGRMAIVFAVCIL